ncbi:hypothetical protein NQZ68_026571 [Dissostichus eleginoides]|nr:hypothetical protein NQZ68_026571 [Dissostichus eleginoides]
MAISTPRWPLSVQSSWIGPPSLSPRQVDNDDYDDDVFDRWSHLDSLRKEQKPTELNKNFEKDLNPYCLLSIVTWGGSFNTIQPD